MKTETMLLYGGGAVAAYFLFLKPSTTGTGTTLLSSILPTSTTVGINSGVKGGNGSFYTCSNYAQLLAANPNLGNPNYIMTDAEANQYAANYSDLQQAFALWIQTGSVKDSSGNNDTVKTVAQASQVHWKSSGCAEKRIFLPLQPPSTANYIPPPVPPKSTTSSNSSWITTALVVGGDVAKVALAGVGDDLNAHDQQALFTMSAVIKDILPLYENADPILTRQIETRLDFLLAKYS